MTILLAFVGASTNFNAEATLTGVAATGAVGTLGAGINVAVGVGSVAANAAVSSVGYTSSVSTEQTGVSASGNVSSVGTITGELVNLSGVSATASAGTTSVGIGENVLVGSVSATAAVASVSFKLSGAYGVNGVAGTSQVSSVTPFIASSLPEGSILLFDRESVGTAIPTGFSLYTEEGGNSVTNFLIKGGSVVSRNTGTSAPISVTSPAVTTTVAAGEHPGNTPLLREWNLYNGTSTLYDYLANTGGSHTHTITLSGSATYPESATLQGMSIPLIRATTNKNIPQGAIIFSGTSTVFSNFTRKTWDITTGVYSIASSVNGSNPSPTPVSPSFTAAISSAGSHNHGRTTVNNARFPGPFQPTVSERYQQDDYFSSVIHNHGGTATLGSLGVYKQFKHLLPLVASTETGVVPGMIVMFNGVTVPSGWLLCDGTNGTPDMQDYFLGFNNDNTGSDTLTGRDVVGGSSGPTATTPAPPPSSYAVESVSVDTGNDDWVHNHYPFASPTQNNGPITSAPFGGHGEKSAPHSHTGTTDKFTMPNAYTPQHLVLLFIQKAE